MTFSPFVWPVLAGLFFVAILHGGDAHGAAAGLLIGVLAVFSSCSSHDLASSRDRGSQNFIHLPDEVRYPLEDLAGLRFVRPALATQPNGLNSVGGEDDLDRGRVFLAASAKCSTHTYLVAGKVWKI